MSKAQTFDDWLRKWAGEEENVALIPGHQVRQLRMAWNAALESAADACRKHLGSNPPSDSYEHGWDSGCSTCEDTVRMLKG